MMELHFAKINASFFDRYSMLCIVCLMVIYPINSQYFACSLFIDKLCFSYYYSQGVVWDILVCLIWVCFVGLLCSHIYEIQRYQKARDQEQIQRKTTAQVQVDSTSALYLSFLLYIGLYSLLIAMLAIYILVESLPSGNFSIQDWITQLVRRWMSFVLAISNALIVPKLVSSSFRVLTKKDESESLKFMHYRPTIISSPSCCCMTVAEAGHSFGPNVTAHV